MKQTVYFLLKSFFKVFLVPLHNIPEIYLFYPYKGGNALLLLDFANKKSNSTNIL